MFNSGLTSACVGGFRGVKVTGCSGITSDVTTKKSLSLLSILSELESASFGDSPVMSIM